MPNSDALTNTWNMNFGVTLTDPEIALNYFTVFDERVNPIDAGLSTFSVIPIRTGTIDSGASGNTNAWSGILPFTTQFADTAHLYPMTDHIWFVTGYTNVSTNESGIALSTGTIGTPPPDFSTLSGGIDEGALAAELVSYWDLPEPIDSPLPTTFGFMQNTANINVPVTSTCAYSNPFWHYSDGSSIGTFTAVATAVPEPGTITLLVSALLGLGAFYLRRRRAKA
jgi:hypothetical protein